MSTDDAIVKFCADISSALLAAALAVVTHPRRYHFCA
jgi:hypothetical protein